jgi:histidine triad (HIT) family protein
LQNNGEEAGQTVFHYHMHLIPRYKGGQEMILWKANSYSDAEMDELAEKLAIK